MDVYVKENLRIDTVCMYQYVCVCAFVCVWERELIIQSLHKGRHNLSLCLCWVWSLRYSTLSLRPPVFDPTRTNTETHTHTHSQTHTKHKHTHTDMWSDAVMHAYAKSQHAALNLCSYPLNSHTDPQSHSANIQLTGTTQKHFCVAPSEVHVHLFMHWHVYVSAVATSLS